MMAKYIKVDAIIDIIDNQTVSLDTDADKEYVKEMIKNMPTVDIVEQKKSEWKPQPTEREWDYCSACGVGTHRREYGINTNGIEWVEEASYAFCPWCGARMENKKSEHMI